MVHEAKTPLAQEASAPLVHDASAPQAQAQAQAQDAAAPLALDGQLWITAGGARFGGPERVALLAAVAAHGSITAAAKAVGISYKGAWDAIDAMNNLAGLPLVERVAGGKGGGGTRLTPRGQQLVDNFHQVDATHRQFLAHLSGQSHALADDFLLLQRMTMQTSARNQFSGTVAAVQRGAVNDEVTLDIVGGQHLVAIITRDSCDALALQPGAQAFALIKASSVIVVKEAGGARFSARNQLTGTISRLLPGAVNTEVSIALPGGASLAAIVTCTSGSQLQLAVGDNVSAIFKASSVILGVPG